ncbi:MAG: D-alanine--D-alanine ligase [Nevskiaceae bacterium]|nr:MAG: D-alanine--D-alanine ligase [Nevskiaceae bacterium]TAM24055.1 MAG: D-alanine--D-alanine ligase [Nevskiaceae bacterium]
MSTTTRPADFGKVAVLMGGWSAERQVSLWSGEGIVKALQSRGVDAHGVDVSSPEQLFMLKAEGYARVFNILHGTGGEDGTVQAILDLLGLPYPGSGVLASALAMDKLTTKRVWKAEGLPTPDFRVLASQAEAHAAAEAFGYPFIIKPAADGSSVGVSKVKTAEQIDAAYALALGEADRVVMAEQFIGRAGKNDEFTCPILLGRALPVIRIEPDGEFYDYNAKYISNDTRYHCPSGLEAGFEAQVQALCLKAFALAGCRHWGRVDFLMGEDGRPQLLELNTLPGMTSHSLVPMAAKAVGIDYAELCWRLLEATL